MSKSKKVLSAVLLISIAAAGAWGYLGGIQNPLFGSVAGLMGKRSNALSAKDYEFKKVVRKDIRQTALATGTVTLHSGAEVKIGARISGQLKKLYAKIGDFVRTGKVIATIDHQDLLARVAQREAELKTEEAQLVKIRTEGPLEINKGKADIEDLRFQLKLAEVTLERNTQLSKEGVVSQSAVDEALEKRDTLTAKIKVAQEELKLREARLSNDALLSEARLEKSRADLLEGKTQLSFATITAPIDGVVAYISTQEGETVVAGLSAPTFVTLIDLRKLEVTTYVDETDIGRSKIGQKAVFTVDSYPEKFFKGTVIDIHPKAVIKDNVVNYEVILEIDKEDIQLLRPEMTTNVSITTGVRPNVLVVPKEAVKRTADKSFVAVRTNGELAEKPVETGWREGSLIEVKSGLNEGDEIGVLIKPRSDGGDKDKRRGRRP